MVRVFCDRCGRVITGMSAHERVSVTASGAGGGEIAKLDFCTYSLDGSDMFLYLHFYRWSEPSIVLAVDTVVKAWLPIPCGAVSACAAELSPC